LAPLVSFVRKEEGGVAERMRDSYIWGFRRKECESLIHRGLDGASVGAVFSRPEPLKEG
jgi:hypothetical protein